MPTIKILPHAEYCPEGAEISAPAGTSICEALLENDIHIEHACEMSCACTTCHLWIKEGDAKISEPDDDELDRMEMAPGLQLNSRLGCQAVITGPGTYTVEIPKWNRNYTSEGKPLAMAENK